MSGEHIENGQHYGFGNGLFWHDTTNALSGYLLNDSTTKTAPKSDRAAETHNRPFECKHSVQTFVRVFLPTGSRVSRGSVGRSLNGSA